MEMISKMMDEMTEEMSSIDVSPDDFERWKGNKVTRRFMLETQHAMLDALEQQGEGPENDIAKFNYLKGMREAFDLLSSWSPGEFLIE